MYEMCRSCDCAIHNKSCVRNMSVTTSVSSRRRTEKVPWCARAALLFSGVWIIRLADNVIKEINISSSRGEDKFWADDGASALGGDYDFHFFILGAVKVCARLLQRNIKLFMPHHDIAACHVRVYLCRHQILINRHLVVLSEHCPRPRSLLWN